MLLKAELGIRMYAICHVVQLVGHPVHPEDDFALGYVAQILYSPSSTISLSFSQAVA
jgi:hypothetical protein